MLKKETDFKVVGEASNGLEAVEKARELSPDVVLMDLRMPEMDGVEAISTISGEGCKALVFAIMDHVDATRNAERHQEPAKLNRLAAAVEENTDESADAADALDDEEDDEE
jgi:chemotaxis response regulator CheB